MNSSTPKLPLLKVLWGRSGRETREWEQGTITWGDVIEEWTDPANLSAVKDDTTGYVFGSFEKTTITHKVGSKPCTSFHRKLSAVVSRCAIVLDVDRPDADFLDSIKADFPHAALIHTTWSHTPDSPRYRMIVPLVGELSPDEYEAVTQWFMEEYGLEQFDKSAAVPNQFSYRPAAEDPSLFASWVIDQPVARADDLRELRPTYAGRATPRARSDKRDQYELPGIAGAFNRAYEDWDELIEAFELPYTAEGEDRYRFGGLAGAPGAGPTSDRPDLWYSHHANDPAAHIACGAFDLVRLHRFGELDPAELDMPLNRRPSYVAMVELAEADEHAKAEMERESTERIAAEIRDAFGDEEWDDDELAELLGGPTSDRPDPNAWLGRLSRNARDSSIRDTSGNWRLMLEHDLVLKSLWFNDLTANVHADRFPPRISTPDGGVNNAARNAIRTYLEETYNGFKPSASRLEQMIDTAGLERRRNPIREWIEGLPEWDGTPRVETAMPGVEPTPHNRMVLRKALVGAIARILDPGCKWDYVLVLYGREGMFKTTWVEKLSNGWHDELGGVSDKDTLMRMRSKWIMTMDESGKTLRQSDFDALKEFITRRFDTYRAPYDRAPVTYPRHNVIWATTNDEHFLKSAEGNRRFLVLNVSQRLDLSMFTDTYIGQLWAEALHLYNNGEPLFLNDVESALAAKVREQFTEEDSLVGRVEAVLDRTGAEWACSRSVWDELNLGTGGSEPSRKDLLPLGAALRKSAEWIPWNDGEPSHPPRDWPVMRKYGRQRWFTRKPITLEDVL